MAEKIGEQPEHQVDSEKLAEFSVPSWLVRDVVVFTDTLVIRSNALHRFLKKIISL